MSTRSRKEERALAALQVMADHLVSNTDAKVLVPSRTMQQLRGIGNPRLRNSMTPTQVYARQEAARRRHDDMQTNEGDKWRALDAIENPETRLQKLKNDAKAAISLARNVDADADVIRQRLQLAQQRAEELLTYRRTEWPAALAAYEARIGPARAAARAAHASTEEYERTMRPEGYSSWGRGHRTWEEFTAYMKLPIGAVSSMQHVLYAPKFVYDPRSGVTTFLRPNAEAACYVADEKHTSSTSVDIQDFTTLEQLTSLRLPRGLVLYRVFEALRQQLNAYDRTHPTDRYGTMRQRLVFSVL